MYILDQFDEQTKSSDNDHKLSIDQTSIIERNQSKFLYVDGMKKKKNEFSSI